MFPCFDDEYLGDLLLEIVEIVEIFDKEEVSVVSQKASVVCQQA